MEYTSTPIFSERKIIGAVVVFRDISLRKQTEERLRRALDEVGRLKEQLQTENNTLRRQIQRVHHERAIIGSSSVLKKTLDLIVRVAATDSTVLVLGETGTGKELVAQALHDSSARRHQPLVRVNCGAIPPQLVESELFGHEKGSFTGATHQRKGRFEQAHNGTLFLDEIGELPLQAQVKLLRALQEREVERVGGSVALPIDARIVAATNGDLPSMVRDGRFRADLYYRLNVVPIAVPPLRERSSDIPELVEHFLQLLEARWGRRLGRPSRAMHERLLAHDWPGNVRELQNVVERAAMLSGSGALELPPDLDAPGEGSPRAVAAAQAEVDVAPLDVVEREHILGALQRACWRVSGPRGAAKMLGLHPNTLRYRMQRMGIRRT